MANGTTREALARADRMRERSKQNQKATRNALEGLRQSLADPGSEPYREEMDSVSETEFVIGKTGLTAKSKSPPWVQIVFAVLALIAFGLWLFVRR